MIAALLQKKIPAARTRNLEVNLYMSPPPPIAIREQLREERFNVVWTKELNRVFADVAPYYDRANNVASLGFGLTSALSVTPAFEAVAA